MYDGVRKREEEEKEEGERRGWSEGKRVVNNGKRRIKRVARYD
jgi:hypothetical protein